MLAVQKVCYKSNLAENYGIAQVRVLVRHGIPFVETLKVADKENLCLIVLGSRGHSTVAEMLSGSTLKNVMRHSRRQVWVVCQGTC